MMVKFHGTLSVSTVHFPILRPGEIRTAHRNDRLVRMCFNDYDREIAINGVRTRRKTKEDEIVAVRQAGRLVPAALVRGKSRRFAKSAAGR